MKRTIDITSEQRKTLLALLARHLPDTTVWVYGSRIQWTARPQSDLDMLVFASPSQNHRVSALREALEESNLPFRIDLFVWDDVPESFRKKIKSEHKVLVEKESRVVDGTWRNMTLRDCIVINDSTISLKEEWHFINYLDTGNITENRISEIQHLVVGKDKIPSRARRKAQIGDIVYSTVRPNQKHFGLLKKIPENFLASTGFSLIRGKDSFAHTDFVYWFLAQDHIVEQLQTIAEHSTSTYPSIKPSDIEGLSLDLPPLHEQRAIAHILGTLDDKIELNRRMNETLEAMAQALFKSWFVDFDPVHAKATLKRHDPHHSLRQHDSAIVQANDTSRTGITPPSKAQANDPSHSGITPPSKSRINDPSRSRITPPLRGSRQDKGEARRRIATTSITPPLRGSRQDKGASPPSSRWGVIKRQYSQQTLQYAKALRQNQTNAEGLLWHYLRNKQLDGHKFRRQQPIGPYIVDFACLPRKLIVELDGGQHAKQKAYDKKRDTFLKDKGYRILRFWNNEVFENCFGVLESIYNALLHHPPLEGGSKDASLSGRGSPPPHKPSPAGSVSATPPRGGSDFHGEAMKDEFRGNTPQGGSEWTPERARAYLDNMDDDIMALFPDSFEDSELGNIPKGWEVKTIGDIATSPRRGISPTDVLPETPYIGLQHMPRNSIALTDWEGAGQVTSGKSMFRRGEILFGKLRPYFHKVGIAPVSGVCSTDIVVVAPKSSMGSSIVLEYFSTDDFVAYTDQTSTGTRMPRTNWKTMSQFKIHLPPNHIIAVFQSIVYPIIECIIANIHQSRTLAAVRDTLLPKLVSGEIRIQEIEKQEEATI